MSQQSASARMDYLSSVSSVTFAYKARTDRGEPVSGTVTAPNQQDAIRALQREGKTVIEIKVGSRPIDHEEIRDRHAAGQVKREDLIACMAQLGVMLETGVPLSEALDAFVAQSKQGGLRRVMQTVQDRITGGMSFSAAMEEFPKVFPPLMVNLMRASEASGTMAIMLTRIAEYLDQERKTIKQIRGALTYPMVMIGVAMTVTVFLVLWVLPRFAQIYSSREAALPAMTKAVMGVSTYITENMLSIGIALVCVAVSAFVFRASSFGRRTIDRIKISLPVIGPMFTHYYLTRSMRTLGTLLASGVQLLDAVRIVRGITNNVHWGAFWDEVDVALTGGRTVEDIVKDSTLIPPSAAYMIAAGERSGRLPEVLEKVSASTAEDLDTSIKSATQLIEPAMIIFMGATIGGVALALLLPIFSVANVMSN